MVIDENEDDENGEYQPQADQGDDYFDKKNKLTQRKDL